jgi:phosphoglycolate phosphatase
MKQEAEAIPLFENVGEVLARLDDVGATLAIVSSNTEENIRRSLGSENAVRIRHFECGASIFGKAARLRKVLRAAGIPAREAIYVGDHVTDLQAAREAGVAFGAVAWGYGTIESLRAGSPDLEFASVAVLAGLAGSDGREPSPSPQTP